MTGYFCNCFRTTSPAQPQETITTPEMRWGAMLHLEFCACSQNGNCTAGLAHVPDSGRPCSSSAGQHWISKGISRLARSREQDFSLIPNEIGRKATLIWVASRCKLATVKFLSNEKCGEGEEEKSGRTQGSWRNDVHFFVGFFCGFFFPLKIHSFE